MTPTKIKITDIRVPSGRRAIDPNWVATLQQDFKTSNGHMVPIEVAPEKTEGFMYRLVFGGHRLEAVAGLGQAEIEAFVLDPKQVPTPASIRMREIAENLIRRELSVLDKAVDIADWRDIYNSERSEAKSKRKSKAALAAPTEDDEDSAKFALNFSDAAQKALGISRRSIYLALKIATIPAPLRKGIATHAIADSQTDLLQLADETPERQASIVRLLTMADDDAPRTVAEAIAVIDRAPKPATKAKWEKLSGDFSRMTPSDQDRFFELHEDAIRRWLKGRPS